jgi:hypothetical protein
VAGVVAWDVRTGAFEGSIRGSAAEDEFDRSLDFLVFEVGVGAIEMDRDPVEGGLVMLEVAGTGAASGVVQ